MRSSVKFILRRIAPAVGIFAALIVAYLFIAGHGPWGASIEGRTIERYGGEIDALTLRYFEEVGANEFAKWVIRELAGISHTDMYLGERGRLRHVWAVNYLIQNIHEYEEEEIISLVADARHWAGTLHALYIIHETYPDRYRQLVERLNDEKMNARVWLLSGDSILGAYVTVRDFLEQTERGEAGELYCRLYDKNMLSAPPSVVMADTWDINPQVMWETLHYGEPGEWRQYLIYPPATDKRPQGSRRNN